MLYVGRNAERRWNERLAASSATASKRTNGLHATHRVAQLVDAAGAGSPGELRVLAGRELLVAVAGELRQLLDHDGAGRAC